MIKIKLNQPQNQDKTNLIMFGRTEDCIKSKIKL